MVAKCSMLGCEKPIKARGLCHAHYMSEHRKNSRSIEIRKKGDARDYLDNVVMKNQSDDCLIWPFSKVKGYGRIARNGRLVIVSRLVCEAVHGEAPTDKHQAAHLCGNGHLGCVNPRHLVWETSSQNQMDRHIHGTAAIGESSNSAKLSKNEVETILKDNTFSIKDLAARFSISYQQVWAIKKRRYWKHVDVDTAA